MATTKRSHPFDQITKEEIIHASQIIKENKQKFLPQKNKQGEKLDWDFISMINLEPPKRLLLPALRKGDDLSKFHRKSLLVLEERGTSNVAQVVVNHDSENSPIERFIAAPGKKAMLTGDAGHAAHVCLKDPRVVDLLTNKYKITDFSLVRVLPWTFGYNGEGPEDAPYNNFKMANVFLSFGVDDIEDNFWAHPTGFNVLVDLGNKVVRKIFDLPTQSGFEVDSSTNFEIPLKKDNYSPKFLREDYYRKDIKKINITQPDGPSFTVKDGYEISWQKWNFRISFNYRTGLVFHYVTYTCNDKVPGKDGDEERGKGYTGEFIKRKHEVLYNASISEMVVPYGDPRYPYNRKSAFDMGEIGVGVAANSLELGCDCIGNVYYFDAHFTDRDGQPITIKKCVCLHEEDAGLAHKHTDTRFSPEKAYLVRLRRLVVSFIATVGNYDYIFNWYFYQDGTISHESKASGEISINLLADKTLTQWGTRVFPLLNAQYHQHIFSARLDFLVDGTKNTAAMLDVVPLKGEFGSEDNPYANGFEVKKTEFKTAKEAITDVNTKLSRVWVIQNDHVINEYSQTPVAWKLIPQSATFGGMLAGETCYIRKRAGFAKHSFWVTPFKDDELYAAGFYVNQSRGGEGLEAWANRNENIKDTDIVVWHTYGSTHITRVEDFPIMPIDTCGFILRPHNFFYQNPALDVPPSTNNYMMNPMCQDCWYADKRTPSLITCKHKSEILTRRGD